MISEEQLQNFEGMANELLYDGSLLKPVIYHLIAEVRELEDKLEKEKKRNERLVWHVNEVNQLEKEADWLANKLALSVYGSCPRDGSPDYHCNSADNVPHDCVACWREAARKETRND